MELHVEDIDPKSWTTREVYANYGLALYAAQVLEHGIANLAVWTGVRDAAITTLDACDIDYADMFRLTMGQAKKTLLARRPDVVQFEALLERAVTLRNFLAHSYFRQRAAAFMTDEGMTKMIEELEKARDFFVEVDSKLQSLTTEIIDAMGMTKHMPEALARASERGFGDPLPGV